MQIHDWAKVLLQIDRKWCSIQPSATSISVNNLKQKLQVGMEQESDIPSSINVHMKSHEKILVLKLRKVESQTKYIPVSLTYEFIYEIIH